MGHAHLVQFLFESVDLLSPTFKSSCILFDSSLLPDLKGPLRAVQVVGDPKLVVMETVNGSGWDGGVLTLVSVIRNTVCCCSMQSTAQPVEQKQPCRDPEVSCLHIYTDLMRAGSLQTRDILRQQNQTVI